MRIPVAFAPWTSSRNVRAEGLTLTTRIKDIMDLVTAERMREQRVAAQHATRERLDELMQRTFLDVSQSHERRKFSHEGQILPTVTTSSMLYSFGLDRVVKPEELFRWHGYPRTLVFPECLSAASLKVLVGNSMSAPCLAQAILSLYVLLHDKYDSPESGVLPFQW